MRRTVSRLAPLLVGALILAILLSVPAWGSSFLKRSIIEFLYMMALAHIWNFMAGYAGMVSIGQQAWIGIGAYALVVLAEDVGVNPFMTVPLAGLAAAILSWPTTWLVFRLRGPYFSIITWILAETIHLTVAANVTWLGGGRGRSVSSVAAYGRGLREDLTYWICVIIAIACVAVIYLVLRSRTGLALMAIRDSEEASGSIGISTYRTKQMVYIVAAGAAGAIGAMIYLNILNVRPASAFSMNWSAYVIFIVIIGGIGSMEGPVIGTIVFFVIREFLSDFEEWSLILFGAIAITFMLVAPRGIWGLISPYIKLEFFPLRRHMSPRLLEGKSAQNS